MKRIPNIPWLWPVALVTLAGFVLRMIHLADVPPRWDEGWSVAHASLSLDELFIITAADVHPPLYYLLLGLWQDIFGVNLMGARYLSVLMSLPAIPLAYAATCAWLHSRRAGLIAAALTAWLPLLVYYSAVIRMYALAPSFVLLATWAALRLAATRFPESLRFRESMAPLVAFIVGAAGAMLTLYHAAWAMAALGVYATLAALRFRRGPLLARVGPLWIAVVLSVLAYLPWAVYALPQLYGRAAAETGANTAQQYPVRYFIENGLLGLTMSQQAGWLGVAILGGLVVAGLAAWLVNSHWLLVIGKSRLLHRTPISDPQSPVASHQLPVTNHQLPFTLSLPVLAILFTLFGVAIAARHWAFNARMLVGAAPALALLLTWAFAQLARLHWGLAAVAAVVVLGVYAPTSASFVYQKSLEVFDPYNPHTYREHIAPQGRPSDVAFFNVLSPAGFYALDRLPSDPAWSYALSWDPVIEPRERWEARIESLAQQHPRFWLVLYRGLAGKNGDLRGWVDSTFFPAQATWGEEEVYYGLYGVARSELTSGEGAGSRWGDLELRRAQLAPAVRSGDVIPVALTWRALAPLQANHKVFVHAVADDGAVIAQHDAQPLNELRPMTTLPVGENVNDRHGLALPEGFAGQLSILVGVYDPATGDRVLTADGRDTVTVGVVDVR